MRVLLLNTAFALIFSSHADAYTCSEVKLAVLTYSKETIAAIKKQMTADELARARECLRRKDSEQKGAEQKPQWRNW